MISSRDLVTAVGTSVFAVGHLPAAPVAVHDVFLVDPGEDPVGQRGDLVLGVGIDATGAGALVDRCAGAGSSGLVLRDAVATDAAVLTAAGQHGLLVAGLQPGVTWAHLVWMLRGVIDRAAAPGSPEAGDAGVHNDLFVLADTAASIVDAPVTIEDNQSRVLAYSSGQGRTDTARVSTIVGRRVPPELVAHFRARGVFRRLASSSEPFLVPAGPDQTLPRFVVPVRAGDEWLGSIWAVVDARPAEEVVADLRNAASVLALHLLRLRAQADVARRHVVERIRSGLRRHTPGADLALPPPPWRVVALGAPSGVHDVEQQLDLWTATCRRHSWHDPLLADVDGVVFAVVADSGSGPGSWPWLRDLVGAAHREDPSLRAASGAPARNPAGLPRSRMEAAEVLALRQPVDRADPADPVRPVGPVEPVQRFEDAWAELTVARATASVDLTALAGPVAVLREHDASRGTAYVGTLRAWLATPGEPRRAAGMLHVHPNTLRHRMGRIAALVELDLADPVRRLALQLQLEATVLSEGPPRS